MPVEQSSRDNEPFAHLGRFPIYVATVLAAAHIAGLCLSGVMLSQRTIAVLMPFHPELFLKGGWWGALVCGFFEGGNMWALLWILMLYRGAVEIERFYGRWVVVKMYVALMFIPPLVSTLCWLSGYNGANLIVYGSGYASLAFFVAFATVYPKIEFIGPITPRAIALFFIALDTVLFAHKGDGVGFLAMLASVAFAGLFMLKVKEGGDFAMGSFVRGFVPRRKPRLRVLPNPPRRTSPPPQEMLDDDEPDAEVDALLDKIAKNGLDSLTPAERAQLEKARQALLKKDRR